MMRKVHYRIGIAVLGLFMCGFVWGEETDFFRSYGWLNPEIETAHITRGKIVAARPVQNTDAGIGCRVGKLGYANIGFWSMTDLNRHYRDSRRDFMNEFDPWIMYGYEWKFAEEWSLDSRISYQWDEMIGYRGGATRTYREYINRETLATPWFSVYSLVRWMVHPYECPGIRVGVFREFTFFDRFAFVPQFFMDGGPRCWNRRRFGQWTPEAAHYRSGPNSATLSLVLKYYLTDAFCLYGGISQFGIVDSGIREQVKARPGDCARRDLTFGVVGFIWQFR